MIKAAVMIIGYPRTWLSTKDSFIKKFGNVDVFFSTYNMMYGYHPVVAANIGDTSDEYVPEGYFEKAFEGINLKGAIIENFADTDRFIKEEVPKLKLQMENTPSSYGQYRKLKIATDMVQKYENDNDFKYDLLVRARCDLVYDDEPMDYSIGENELVYNAGGVTSTDPMAWEFLSDHLFMAKRDDMIGISEFMYNVFYNPIYEDCWLNTPHGLLSNSLRHNKLTKVNRPMIKHILRKTGFQQII